MAAMGPGYEERIRVGRALRNGCPRSAPSRWRPPQDRRDVVDVILQDCRGRRSDLVPVRLGRMASSPIAFMRGAALIMAYDLAELPRTSLVAQVCGDAHCGNFGTFASPKRAITIDVNDFDDTARGPWEIDVLRLAASLYVTARENGCREADCAAVAERSTAAYRETMWSLAEMGYLDLQYTVVDALQLVGLKLDPRTEKLKRKALDQGDAVVSERKLSRLTEVGADGRRRFMDKKPFLSHVPETEEAEARAAFERYIAILEPQWHAVLGRYKVVDVALKVVGVGSVGLRDYAVLLSGTGESDTLMLQLKEARESPLSAAGETSRASATLHQGERVVLGQKCMQAAHDPLLGWTRLGNADAYVRQLPDWKGHIPLEGMPSAVLVDLGRIRGAALAKAHARTLDPAVLAGYLGLSNRFDRSVAIFARLYARQTEEDHAALKRAIAESRVEAVEGV